MLFPVNWFSDGLDLWDGVGLLGFSVVEFLFALVELVAAFDELAFFAVEDGLSYVEADGGGGQLLAVDVGGVVFRGDRGKFGGGCDGAEFGVEDDFFDGFGVDAVGAGFFFGQVEAGDLEAVEEQAGAAGVEVVGGDALEDEADGGLDGGAVFGEGELEGVGLGEDVLAAAGGVVVVAEVFVAEADGGAAVSVGEDVAALMALGVGHGFLPPGYLLV